MWRTPHANSQWPTCFERNTLRKTTNKHKTEMRVGKARQWSHNAFQLFSHDPGVVGLRGLLWSDFPPTRFPITSACNVTQVELSLKHTRNRPDKFTTIIINTQCNFVTVICFNLIHTPTLSLNKLNYLKWILPVVLERFVVNKKNTAKVFFFILIHLFSELL